MRIIRKILKYVGYGSILTGAILLVYKVFGWAGIITISVLPILVLVFFGFMVYGFGRSFVYTEKEIGKELKGFLGYDFGNEYEVLANETRVHGDRPVHFLIRIPEEAMKGVEDFCRTKRPSKCTAEGCEKYKEYKDDKIDYVLRREYMTINFKDCTIDFRGVSC